MFIWSLFIDHCSLTVGCWPLSIAQCWFFVLPPLLTIPCSLTIVYLTAIHWPLFIWLLLIDHCLLERCWLTPVYLTAINWPPFIWRYSLSPVCLTAINWPLFIWPLFTDPCLFDRYSLTPVYLTAIHCPLYIWQLFIDPRLFGRYSMITAYLTAIHSPLFTEYCSLTTIYLTRGVTATTDRRETLVNREAPDLLGREVCRGYPVWKERG